MAIEVKSEVFVERTPEEVAQVMFNPKLDKLWIRGLSEVYPMESGLYRKGAKIERIGTFLKKKYSAKLLVTKFEKNSFVQIYADEPFEMSIKYRLKASDGGTNVSITIASISEVDFNSPVSIISKSIKDSVDDDLKRFKLHLENNES